MNPIEKALATAEKIIAQDQALDATLNGPSLAARYAAALNEKFPVVQAWDQSFGFTSGKRFDRITRQRDGKDRSVHAFVERSTGKLIKAAGWTAPAKLSNGELQSQYNLSTPEGFAEAVAAADPYTSYLYVR